MKITNQQLKQIIKEEIQNLLLEVGEDEGITPETAIALRRCWVHLMMSYHGAGLFRGKRIANTSSSENTNEVNAKNMTQRAMDYYIDNYTNRGSDVEKIEEARLVFDYVDKIHRESGMPGLNRPRIIRIRSAVAFAWDLHFRGTPVEEVIERLKTEFPNIPEQGIQAILKKAGIL